MNTKRRVFWLMTILSFLLFTTGCSSSHLRPVDHELAREGTGLFNTSGQKISGYRLQNAAPISFEGWAKVTHEDSLSFWSTKVVSGLSTEYDSKELVPVTGPVFAISTVKTLNVVEPSTVKTVFAALFAGGVIGLVISIGLAEDEVHDYLDNSTP